MTDLDDWPAPTEWKRGPFTLRRSNAGYGWDLVLGRRVQLRSRKATTPMWPRFIRGADENCNRAVTLVLWPLGSVDVWWEPKYRTGADGPCETCRADFRREGCCEWCGSRPCGCDILRPDHVACPDTGNMCDRCRGEFEAWVEAGKPAKAENAGEKP